MFRTSIYYVIFGFLIILFGFTTFALSQIHVSHTKFSPQGSAVFNETLWIPFEGDAMHGAYGYLQWRTFSIKASLKNETHYIMTFENNWLNIHSINIKAPNGDTISINQNLSFTTTTEGTYTFSVSGYYRYKVSLDRDGRYVLPKIDDTVKISIFALGETRENINPYSFLLPTAPILWITGVVLPILWYSKNRNVHAQSC